MDKVLVLMSTYNGEKYLKTQIDSLLAQEGVEVEILVRDDGSKDRTLEILDEYKNAYTKAFIEGGHDEDLHVSYSDAKNAVYGSDEIDTEALAEGIQKRSKASFDYYIGENLGPAGSFLDLMKHAPEADFYALCDQDDTWLPDKLKIAVDAIKQGIRRSRQDYELSLGKKSISGGSIDGGKLQNHSTEDIPVLYYGMPRFSDNDGNLLKGAKGIYEKSLDFSSCLIKSNSTGCTMVFNRTLLELINSKTPGSITMHDEWLHKVCLAMGGMLLYDEDVHILYRQHGGNTIGGQLSTKKILKRYIETLTKPDCIRSRCIRSLVECYGKDMPENNLEMAEKVASYKDSLENRMKLFLDNDIKMEYHKRNIMFKLAVLLGIF
ncbi:glycosyltransferase [Oribacterium sp. WCC10]|uniref:glycosyltransferase n=1 Tax=Oribacterium sp. WCC10 TaxID=1855343 RepID=UPI0008E9F6B3|nr:glycosyltransferase [Oribacterium sp. WCC10]SFG36617.1 rhamnosyltransferase [Oribacterium sp. WCC10]